jgi:hypothetical protein
LLNFGQPLLLGSLHIFFRLASGVPIKKFRVDLQECLAISEILQDLLCPLRVSANVETSCQRFDTIQSPGLAVVDRIRGDKVWDYTFTNVSQK